jgi:hypothetical protein
LEIVSFQKLLNNLSLNRIGPGTPSLSTTAPEIDELMLQAAKILNHLQDRITSLGRM